MLTKNQKNSLLKIARDAIETNLAGKLFKAPESRDPLFKEKRGVFVTLKKNGKLRGCIGYIQPIKSLVDAVSGMAVQSATEDPRFSPVSSAELKNIVIEISVLTVPERINNAEQIVLGKDGVIVKKGYLQGVFLPQVAIETNWNLEEFMNNLCMYKAGLPKDAWKNPNTEIYTFQTEVFSEDDL
jgi:AmmeMemoRadiSam system protein A